MTHATTDRMANVVRQARQHWRRELVEESQHMQLPPAPPAAVTVAISREIGTNAEDVARRLGERLGWTVYDHELIEHIASESNLRTELLESLDEKSTHWVADWLGSLVDVQTPKAYTYFHELTRTVMSLASHGRCIIVGRGAAMLLPMETTLSVRLVAPVTERIQAVAVQRGVSEKEAKRVVKATDRERREFIKNHFHCDSTQPEHYDLVINVTRFTQEQCADLMETALRRLTSG